MSDPAGLQSFLADIYNPSSPNFHHFLSVAEFTARFGPTQDQYAAVLQFAKVNGLAVTGGSRDAMDGGCARNHTRSRCIARHHGLRPVSLVPG